MSRWSALLLVSLAFAPAHVRAQDVPIRTVALSGTRLPGARNRLEVFEYPSVGQGGHVVFLASPAFGRGEGYWLANPSPDGSIELVAMEGQEVDGSVIGSALGGAAVVNPDGVVALSVTLVSGAIGPAILRYRDGELHIAVSSDDVPPGTLAAGQPFLNAQGRIAFSDGASTFVETDVGLQRVVGVGDVVGSHEISSAQLVGWYDDGTASIVASLEDDPTPTVGRAALLYWDGSAVSIVAQDIDRAQASDPSGVIFALFDPVPFAGGLSTEYLVGDPSGPATFHAEMDGGIFSAAGHVSRFGALIGPVTDGRPSGADVHGIGHLEPFLTWVARQGDGSFDILTSTTASNEQTAVRSEVFGTDTAGIWIQPTGGSRDLLGPIVHTGAPLEIAPGDERSVTRVRDFVDATYAGRHRLINDDGHLAFIVEWDGGSGVFVTNQAEVVSADIAVRDLSLTPVEGGGVDARFTVVNDGSGPITHLTVTLTSDPALELSEVAPAECEAAPGGAVCSYVGVSGGMEDLLSPGGEMEIVVPLRGEAAGSYDITVNASSPAPDPDPDDNTVTETVSTADLPRIELTATRELDDGVHRFRMTVRNTGDEPVERILARLQLDPSDAGWEYLRTSTIDCLPNIEDPAVLVGCHFDVLRPGEEVLFVVELATERENVDVTWRATATAVGARTDRPTPTAEETGAFYLGGGGCAVATSRGADATWPVALGLLGLGWITRRRRRRT